MIRAIAESDFEELLIEFFEGQEYKYIPGPTISPDGESPERENYSEVILKERLRKKLSEFNPNISKGLIEDAVRKITSISSNSLIVANLEFHEMLIQGVRLESKRKDGTIAGEFVKTRKQQSITHLFRYKITRMIYLSYSTLTKAA